VESVVSYCGLTCISCLIYCMTREENEEVKNKLRVRIAQISNEHYGTSYIYKDISDCGGCRSESGRIFSSCVNCGIRKCAREKNFQTCAHCPEYACSKLEAVFSSDPSAKTWLDVIKSIL